MDYQELPASAPFDQLISCVWFLTGRGDQYAPQPVVPDGRLELLLHLGDPFSRLEQNGSIHRQDCLLAAGQLTGPIHLAPGRWIDVVGVRLTPLGAHAILAFPLSQLTNQVVSLHDVRPAIGVALQTAATRAVGRAERAEMIVRALARFVEGRLDTRMTAALDFLAAGHRGSLESLAERCGMGARTMERRFLNEVGLSPKAYQRVVRFRRAFRMLGLAGVGSWAQVAVSNGYFDQAHLIRDFSQFAGASPRLFFDSSPALAQAFITANHGGTEPAV